MAIGIIKLPVLPHIKKVILHQYNGVTPIKAELHTMLGKQLQFLLLSKEKFTPINERYTEYLEVEISDYFLDRDNRIGRLAKVNHYYDEYFKQLMYNFVEAQRLAGVPAIQAVRNFLKFYRITESEYSMESAHRAWTRYNSKEYSRKKSKSTVLMN